MKQSVAIPVDPETVEAMISLDDDGIRNIDTLVGKLAKKGFAVTNVMDSLGIIGANIAHKDFAQIREMAGVADIEASGEVSIAPPDAETQ
jgi:hypothetical protein